MYHFEKTVFWWMLKPNFFSWRPKCGAGDRIAEARRRRKRLGVGFVAPGGHSENLEARRSFLRGSWRLCTPSLVVTIARISRLSQFTPKSDMRPVY